MKISVALALSPILLLVPPSARAQSTVSGTLPGGYSYYCSFVAPEVVEGRLSGSPGTLTVTAGVNGEEETESGTSSVLATASVMDTTSGCIFQTPNGYYSVTITSS